MRATHHRPDEVALCFDKPRDKIEKRADNEMGIQESIEFVKRYEGPDIYINKGLPGKIEFYTHT